VRARRAVPHAQKEARWKWKVSHTPGTSGTKEREKTFFTCHSLMVGKKELRARRDSVFRRRKKSRKNSCRKGRGSQKGKEEPQRGLCLLSTAGRKKTLESALPPKKAVVGGGALSMRKIKVDRVTYRVTKNQTKRV